MEYKFKKFEGRNVRLEDRITITRSNSIGFPRKFYQDNRIKDFKHVILYFDKSKNAIALHFTNEEDKNGFNIIHSKAGYGGAIVARSFFRTYNINPEIYYGRYNWKKHKLEGVGEIFVIELKKRENK